MTTQPDPQAAPELVERLIHVACEAADIHIGCSWPVCTCKQIPAAIRACLAALQGEGGPDAGWVWVPREPTREMCQAGAATTYLVEYKTLVERDGQERLGTDKPVPAPIHDLMAAFSIYRAMLAAARTAPPAMGKPE